MEAVYESKEAKHRSVIDFRFLPADYVIYLDNYKLTLQTATYTDYDSTTAAVAVTTSTTVLLILLKYYYFTQYQCFVLVCREGKNWCHREIDKEKTQYTLHSAVAVEGITFRGRQLQWP